MGSAFHYKFLWRWLQMQKNIQVKKICFGFILLFVNYFLAHKENFSITTNKKKLMVYKNIHIVIFGFLITEVILIIQFNTLTLIYTYV